MSSWSTGQPRVVLRRVAACDQERFVELAVLSATHHEPWVRLPQSREDFTTYLERFDQVTSVGFVVCLRSNGDLAGMVNINGIVRDSYQRGVLGYAAFLPYAGQGYLAEGVGLAVRYGFDRLGLHRLEADIQPGNTPSLKLVERLGFRYEGLSPAFINIGGTWYDHERWAINSDMQVR